MAVTDFFDRGWRAHPDRAAFIAGERAFTYTEIGELSCRVGNALLGRGIKPEAKGAVLAGNDPLAWACVLGMWRAGMAWVPVNPAYPEEEIQRLLDSFDCEVLFCHEQFLPIVEKLRPELKQLHTVVSLGADTQAVPAADAIVLQSFTEGASNALPDYIPEQDSLAGIMPTGGTTGAPKGAMNTNRSPMLFVAAPPGGSSLSSTSASITDFTTLRPGNGSPMSLRTVLRCPSAPTRYRARMFRPSASCAVTPSAS